jgi:hypothetical protein
VEPQPMHRDVFWVVYSVAAQLFFAPKHFICRREMGSFQLRIKYKISINLLSERIPRFSRVENLNPFLAPNNASWRFSRVENLNLFFTRLGMLPAVLVG